MVYTVLPPTTSLNLNYAENRQCWTPIGYPNWDKGTVQTSVTPSNPYYIINNYSTKEIPAYESIIADSDESAIEIFNKRPKNDPSWAYSKLCKVPITKGKLDYINVQMLVSDKYPLCMYWNQSTPDSTGSYINKSISKCISSDKNDNSSKLKNVSNLEDCEQYAKDNPTYKVTYCNEKGEPTYINASEDEIGTPYYSQDMGVFNNVNYWKGPLIWQLQSSNNNSCVPNYQTNMNDYIKNPKYDNRESCIELPYSKDVRYSYYPELPRNDACRKQINPVGCNNVIYSTGSNVCPECYGLSQKGTFQKNPTRDNIQKVENGCILTFNNPNVTDGTINKTVQFYSEEDCKKIITDGLIDPNTNSLIEDVNITYCSAGEKKWVAGRCQDDPSILNINDPKSCTKLDNMCK